MTETIPENIPENLLAPFHVFRFAVEFREDPLNPQGGHADLPLCSGAFSEVSGLEASMEPKTIKEGGRNYGANQRAGQVTFATVVLKRGMTHTRDLWKWFERVSGGAYTYRMEVTIKMLDMQGDTLLTWKLEKAMPVKFKSADLSARNNEIGIEELHLVHEGLRLVRGG
jgi:phage tail-like protein